MAVSTVAGDCDVSNASRRVRYCVPRRRFRVRSSVAYSEHQWEHDTCSMDPSYIHASRIARVHSIDSYEINMLVMYMLVMYMQRWLTRTYSGFILIQFGYGAE